MDMLCKFQLVLNISSAVRFHVYNIHVVDMSKMIFNASLFTSISAPMADYIRCRKYCEESHYEQSVSWTLESAAALFRGQVNGTR